MKKFESSYLLRPSSLRKQKYKIFSPFNQRKIMTLKQENKRTLLMQNMAFNGKKKHLFHKKKKHI